MAAPKLCTVPECDKPRHAHGWCKMHYQRWCRNGTVETAADQTPVGSRFSRLVVLGRVAGRHRRAQWLCRCNCGTVKAIMAYSIKSGHTRSCGCLHHEEFAARIRKHGRRATEKRNPKDKTYSAWQDAKARTGRPDHPNAKRYYLRGIRMCERWRNSFEDFLADMGECPPGHSLDRHPDNDGDYEPGNCRWATPTEQIRNRSSTVSIKVDGEIIPLAEAAEKHGVSLDAAKHRLSQGWPIDQVLAPESQRGRKKRKQRS